MWTQHPQNYLEENRGLNTAVDIVNPPPFFFKTTLKIQAKLKQS